MNAKSPHNYAPRHAKPKNNQGKNFLAFVAILLIIIMLGYAAIVYWPSNRQAAAPEPAPAPAPAPVAEDVHIPNSPAIEMYIPHLDLHADFEDVPCRTVNGVIDPVTLDLACVYTSDDRPYQLPGTDAEDIVVIAGHTGGGVSAVFDDLYDGRTDEHRVNVGDVMYIRTVDSGDQWLSYTASDLHDPPKTGLATSDDIWGTEPTPGRLLTISCVQPANPFAPSVRNAVVGWQYSGATTESPLPA